MRTEPPEQEEGHDEHGEHALGDRPLVAHGLHRATVEPGEHRGQGDGPHHHYKAPELRIHPEERVGRGAQHRVEGRVVPHRRDVIRRLQRVRLLEIRRLQEVAAHLRGEEHHGAEHDQEQDDRREVVADGVIGVEGDGVQGLAVLVLVLFHIDAIGVVGPHVVQRNDVQEHQHDQHDGQGHNVQGKEAV